MSRGGRNWRAPRPDILPPAMVRDKRFPNRWGVLRQRGTRAARVQFGADYRTTREWVRFEYLELVPQEEIDAALERERANRKDGEDLV